MTNTFYKYQGTGNDFVMIDNRNLIFPKENTNLVAHLCHRRFGIGADGLILLENDTETDFKMVYYNSDGNQSTMCGNGGRCIVAFAKFLGIIEKKTLFSAVDGNHEALVSNSNVDLKMNDVNSIVEKPNAFYLDTGSPHHVQLINDISSLNVENEGKKLRYGLYGESGSNINFVEALGDSSFAVRTYERGVENETLSCGTGVTAVAIAMNKAKKTASDRVRIETKGGSLKVRFTESEGKYSDVWLYGEAIQVFQGEITW